MPGGSPAAWPAVKPILQAISAKVAADQGSGTVPCCDWVGENGAGHFVKMVHNGIEYGDMQLICETYDLLKNLLGLSYDEMGDVFDEWNRGSLGSYLIEITRDILRFKDEDGQPLAEKILDTAGQKGTGKWTGVAALEFGVPLTLIGEAVFARCLSAVKDERVRAAGVFSGPKASASPLSGAAETAGFIADLGKALYASKVVSYAQGYLLMREAAKEYKWNLNYGGIALMWRGGCIIRSVFLGKIKEAFDKKPDLENLLLDPFFTGIIEDAQASWRRVVSAAVQNGIPVPAFASALTYFDGYRSKRLPANILQAQRDYFGAHTYERVDKPRGEFFHTNWTGHGGTTSASTYTV
jgi:6-phosphogluconate dehydrogenase